MEHCYVGRAILSWKLGESRNVEEIPQLLDTDEDPIETTVLISSTFLPAL